MRTVDGGSPGSPSTWGVAGTLLSLALNKNGEGYC